MKVKNLLVALACAASVSACSTNPMSMFDPGSGIKSDIDQVDDSPVAVAELFLNTVQPGVDYEVYEAFLHPNVQEMLDQQPGHRRSYFQRAVQENGFVGGDIEISEANVKTHRFKFSEQTHVFYALPEELRGVSLEEAYPGHILSGRGLTLRQGEVILSLNEDGKWRVTQHRIVYR